MCTKYHFVPKQFLGRFPLKAGAKVSAIIFIIVELCYLISSIVLTINMKECTSCGVFVWRSSYAYNIVMCTFCAFMMASDIWLLWGIRGGKSTVVSGWLAVRVFWFVLNVALLAALLILLSIDQSVIVWFLCLFFAVVFFAILLYLFFVIYGYWKETKNIVAERIANET